MLFFYEENTQNQKTRKNNNEVNGKHFIWRKLFIYSIFFCVFTHFQVSLIFISSGEKGEKNSRRGENIINPKGKFSIWPWLSDLLKKSAHRRQGRSRGGGVSGVTLRPKESCYILLNNKKKVKAQNILRTYEEKKIRFVTTLDLNECLKQVR